MTLALNLISVMVIIT